MIDFASARRTMVDNQMRTYDITNPAVVAAFEHVPREHFVDSRQSDIAYLDRELNARDSNRRLMVPLVMGRLIQALDVQPGEKVLDVAGGAGYSATIFYAMGAKVTALETSVDATAAALKAADVNGIAVLAGDVTKGVGEGYDAIFVNGSVPGEPSGLLARLAEGGRLAVVIGTGRAGRATIFRKVNGRFSSAVVFDAMAPALPEFAAAPAFQF